MKRVLFLFNSVWILGAMLLLAFLCIKHGSSYAFALGLLMSVASYYFTVIRWRRFREM